MIRNHYGQHGGDCFGCKLHSIQFSNVTPPVERVVEQRQNRDLPAYARLRSQGLQPRSTRGCAELETRANTQLEIEMGKLIDPALLRRHHSEISDGMNLAKEAGYGIDDIRTWRQEVH